MSVPRNKLKPIFLFGFLTSPAINVTLFQASLLKIEPTIAAEMAPKIALPATPPKISPSLSRLVIVQASAQFAFHISLFAASKKPKMMRPNKDNNLITVNEVCNSFPSLMPRVLI